MEKGQVKWTDTLQTDNVIARKEYIEREAVIKRFSFATLDCLGMEPTIRAADVVAALKSIPAADVMPARHGRWIPVGLDDADEGMFKCSECGSEHFFPEILIGIPADNFCANCGARMDGDGE